MHYIGNMLKEIYHIISNHLIKDKEGFLEGHIHAYPIEDGFRLDHKILGSFDIEKKTDEDTGMDIYFYHDWNETDDRYPKFPSTKALDILRQGF